MPVVLMTALPGVGGSALSTAAIARGLVGRGWEVHVATTGPAHAAGLTKHRTAPLRDHVVSSEDHDGVLWHYPDDPPHPTLPGSVLSWARYRSMLEEMVYRISPAVLNPHYITAYAQACFDAAAASGRRVPVVSSAHGTDVSLPPEGLREATAAALRSSAAITSISAALAEQIRRTYGISGAIQVIRNPMPELAAEVDEASRREAAGTWGGASPSTRTLIHVSNLRPIKRASWCVDALCAAVRQGIDARLVIVGDGADSGPIRSRAEELSLQERVLHLGVREDARNLIAAADLLLLPSADEGLSRVLAEAASVGTPSVAFDVGGISEILQDKVTGNLVPAAVQSPEVFAEAVVAALQDEHLPERCAKSGPEATAAHTDEDLTIGAYHRLLSQFL